MVTFLTPEWIDALDAAARAHQGSSSLLDEATFVVEQTVTGIDGDDVTYHVTFDRGRMSVRPGPAPEATIRFSQDLATAVDLATGRSSAQAAFMAGRLQVGGDLTLLTTNGPAFSDLGDVFAEVRARTTMPATTAGSTEPVDRPDA